MKKKITIIAGFSLFFAVLIVLGVLTKKTNYKYLSKQNVFDQMYYTRVHKDFDWWSSKNYRGLFTNMEQLENISRDSEQIDTNYGNFNEQYKSVYIEKRTELKISFYSKREKKMTVIYRIGLNEDESKRYDSDYKWYYYVYSVDNKTLTYTTNDPENTHKDFLYTIFLKDWFEANPNEGFSMDNLGEFTVVERENPTMEKMP